MSKNHFIEKAHSQARQRRQLNRQLIFSGKRISSYLNSYEPLTKRLIKESMENDVPIPLPPLSVTSISYYRRSQQPVFKVREEGEEMISFHMAYESLWMLAGIEEIDNFPNFHKVIKEFERDLPIYLQAKYQQIREMAIIAAGNKILGHEEDILKIVNEDDDQLWVLVNHIYEKKISFIHLYPFLKRGNNEIAFRTIFQMSNNHKDQVIESIMSHEEVLRTILEAFNHQNRQIQSYAVRIIGNILAEKEEYAYDLMKFHILDHLYPLLKNHNDELRKDVCWTVSNYAFEKQPTSDIIYNSKFLERLLLMFRSKEKIQIKKQLYHIFCNLIEKAEKPQIYKIAVQENLIEQCSEDLVIDDVSLNKLTLYMILKMIDLGEYFVVPYEEENQNYFGEQMKNMPRFKEVINEKTFSQNSDITDYSMEIQDKLQLNEYD